MQEAMTGAEPVSFEEYFCFSLENGDMYGWELKSAVAIPQFYAHI